jgi:CheY-like chemotaxis protein
VGGRGRKAGLPRIRNKKEIVVVSFGGCGRRVFKVGVFLFFMVKRILVFDDKPENLRVAQQAYDKLAKYGFSVETTSNPDEALDKIERGEADILVTDLYAPREMASSRVMNLWGDMKRATVDFFRKNPELLKYVPSLQRSTSLAYTHTKDGQIKWNKLLKSKGDILYKHPDSADTIEMPVDGPISINRFVSLKNPYGTSTSIGKKWEHKERIEDGQRRLEKDRARLEELSRELNSLPKKVKKSQREEIMHRIESLKKSITSEGERLPLLKQEYLDSIGPLYKDNFPVGIVLYDAAKKRGIEANIVTDTHRHALEGQENKLDILQAALPLIVQDPSLIVPVGSRSHLDPSRIRTNANKQEVSSWYYGGGYKKDSASFLPEELRGLSGETLEEKLEQKGNSKNTGLGKNLTPVIATIGILSGIFFLSTNITGNAIANVSQNSGNIWGAVLLVVGLVAGFFWVKKK